MWHDEYKCADTKRYIHGILLIPVDKKSELIDILRNIRKEFTIDEKQKQGYAGSLKSRNKAKFLRNHFAVLSHILIRDYADKETKLYNENGRMEYEKSYESFYKLVGCFDIKLGLLIVENNHADMFGRDHSSKVETTLRFGLKGLAHIAFDDTSPVQINNFYFDGIEHHKRQFDFNQIIGQKDWNTYVSVSDNPVIDDRHRDKRNADTGMIMDLVDMAVGGFYNKLFNDINDEYGVFMPLNEIIERLQTGLIIKNKNSRWHKAITVSNLHVVNNELQFVPMEYKVNNSQQRLL